MADFLTLMKQAAIDAVEANNPISVVFGVVENTNPLMINIEQKMVLTSEFLILTNAVKDHYVEMTVDHKTEMVTLNADHHHTALTSLEGSFQTTIENTVDPSSTIVESQAQTSLDGQIQTTIDDIQINLNHSHHYSGRKKFLVHSGLKTGEKVILLRIQGGQRFIVLERLVQ